MSNVVKVTTIGSAFQSVYLLNGDNNKASSVYYSIDGGGANAAVTLARQGFDVNYMGTLGNDLAGRAVLDLFDAEGIDISDVKYTNRLGTGYKVLVTGNSNAKYIYEGTSGSFNLLDIDDLKRQHPDWVYITDMSACTEKLREIIETCTKLKIKIMLNPGHSAVTQSIKIGSLLDDIDVLLVDKTEAKALFDGNNLEELARHALNLTRLVIITDDVNGAIATDGKTLVRADLYEDVPVVDRSGAGDSFGAGFLSQWAKGKSLNEAVWFASANATAVISGLGSLNGILPPNAKLHRMPIHEEKL